MPAHKEDLYPPIMINRDLVNIVNIPKEEFRQTNCRDLMQFPKQTPPVPYTAWLLIVDLLGYRFLVHSVIPASPVSCCITEYCQ